MRPNAHSSITYNCQDMEATFMSINRWMGKKAVECVCVSATQHMPSESIHVGRD